MSTLPAASAVARIVVRSHKDPFLAASAENVLGHNLIGNNAGNLLFSEAVCRLLSRPDSEVQPSRVSAADEAGLVEQVDHVVLPLANAFRPSFRRSLDRLSRTIEKLDVPVSVIGVGVQGLVSGDTGKADAMAEPVRRFVRAVLDRSPSIGVRGEVTADYLARLGFGAEHVEVIGCPAMFRNGAELPVPRTADRLRFDDPMALTLSPYVPAIGPLSLRLAAENPRLTYLAQDHLTLELLLTGRYPAERSPGGVMVEGAPTSPTHPLLAQRRTRMCLDPVVWVEHLRRYRFCFGTRIHGSIAAVMAGTPALVLAHDSRTLELAQYHELPYRLLGELPDGVSPVQLYAEADWGPMISGHQQRWERFAGFLRRHGLRHAYDEGGDRGAAFDARLASRRFPGPVGVNGPIRQRIARRRLAGHLG